MMERRIVERQMKNDQKKNRMTKRIIIDKRMMVGQRKNEKKKKWKIKEERWKEWNDKKIDRKKTEE